jgi:hypothetical protein
MTLHRRLAEFWGRHRRLFWMLHSVWALATGVVVILLARERYAFVPWVVLFLALTWASTLLFGRQAKEDWAPTLGSEVTSYITRSLYQETLFFLLPFYAYSTVFGSPNVLFLGLLGGLAVLSCLDLVFDRWLRTRPVFGLVFFATVAFAAANLLIPILFDLAPRWATPLAAAVAVGTSLPLTLRGGDPAQRSHLSRGARFRIGAAGAAILAVALLVPSLVPPVPLRMKTVTFASQIDRASLAMTDTLGTSVPAGHLGNRIVVLAEVFAPGAVPARVQFEWRRDGMTLRTSRPVDIVAHESSFRVWDALTDQTAPLGPGRYEVILRTTRGRWFGRAVLHVTD